MHTIERALRLLDTQSANLGVLLALVASAAVILTVSIRAAREQRLHVGPALLIVGAGLLVGTGIVEGTYQAWYKHRCVEHHSDIPECDAAARWAN